MFGEKVIDTKDAYYFSHDANARNDPKILDMISRYNMVGYAWFWVLVEMLREQSEYKLKLNKCNVYAMQMQCTSDEAKKYIQDCINEFELFKTDDVFFWSDSLINRMKLADEKSEKRRNAALTRWNKINADAMQMQCNAIKGNESKGNKKKDIYITAQNLTLTKAEYEKLVDQYGKSAVDSKIEYARNYKKLKNYVSLYKTLNNWLKADKEKSQDGYRRA
jgi:hypothetical protein